VTAVKKGAAIDTSMGKTPMEGLVMMTRSGDIDPGIIFELIGKKIGEIKAAQEYNIEDIEEAVNKVEDFLNHDSGIRGLAGGIGDYLSLIKEVSLGGKAATLAFDKAVYNLVKYIGSYYAVLEGKLDALVFTGRIGAGNPITRNAVMNKLRFTGKTPVFAIEPNEELMMARKALEILEQ
jgi:acetate kinase